MLMAQGAYLVYGKCQYELLLSAVDSKISKIINLCFVFPFSPLLIPFPMVNGKIQYCLPQQKWFMLMAQLFILVLYLFAHIIEFPCLPTVCGCHLSCTCGQIIPTLTLCHIHMDAKCQIHTKNHKFHSHISRFTERIQGMFVLI